MRASGMPRRTVRKMLGRGSNVSEAVGTSERAKNAPDDFANVGRDEVANELLGVLIDRATLLNGGLDRSKVVVGKDHVGSELGDCTRSQSSSQRLEERTHHQFPSPSRFRSQRA